MVWFEMQVMSESITAKCLMHFYQDLPSKVKLKSTFQWWQQAPNFQLMIILILLPVNKNLSASFALWLCRSPLDATWSLTHGGSQLCVPYSKWGGVETALLNWWEGCLKSAQFKCNLRSPTCNSCPDSKAWIILKNSAAISAQGYWSESVPGERLQ